MNDDLRAVQDAWDRESGEGRDEAAARALADEYVDAHPEEFASLREMSLEQCVQAIDVFRAAGMEAEQWKVEAWLLHHYEPQNIGGTYSPTVRAH